VNQDKAIAEKFEKADTGIKIQYVAVTTDDVTKRAVTAPNSFDLIDTEYFSLKKIIPTGNLLGIDTKRIKNADKITTLFTKGEVAGKKVGDQGTAPKKVMYLEGPRARPSPRPPTQFMTLIPTVYNADTLGIRPDLIKRPIDSWKELLNPEFKGKAAILNIPHRHHGRGDGGRGDGPVQVPRQGQHDQEGNRPHHQDADRGQEGRPVPRAVEGLQRVGQPDGQRRGGDPVDVVAGRDRGAHQGHRLHLPAAEGGLSRLGRRLRRAQATLKGKKLDGAYEFINWFLDGWAGAYLNRQGYYSAVLETAKAKMEAYEWAYWMEGKPATQDIKSPNGDLLAKTGAVRDGGSYEQRMGGIACWNAVMDENEYMVQKWNEFVAA
jgi:putative spermidine/putrescine transport system substrate-binding protein